MRIISAVLFLSLSALSFETEGQTRLALRNFPARKVLEEGKRVGITRIGEEFAFSAWRTVCTGCQNIYCLGKVGELDSIQRNYMVVKYPPQADSSYRYDTITRLRSGKERQVPVDWQLMEEITSMYDPDENLMVYRYPIHYDYHRIPYDSIASITFAKAEECRVLSPIFPLGALVLLLGPPIWSWEDEKFQPNVFFISESAGLLAFYLIRRHNRAMLLKTYEMSKWKIKPID